MPLIESHALIDQEITSYVNLQLIVTIPRYTKSKYGTEDELSTVLLNRLLQPGYTLKRYALEELRFMFFALTTKFELNKGDGANLC